MKRNLIPKLIVMLTISIILILSCSCQNEFEFEDLTNITYDQMLSQSEGEYIVFCWEVDCSNCKKVKETVEKYYRYQKKHKDAVKLYGLNVNLKYNKDIVLTEGEYNYMYDVTDYHDIKLRATPAFFIIEKGRVKNIISDYSTKLPVTKGKELLESLMQ